MKNKLIYKSTAILMIVLSFFTGAVVFGTIVTLRWVDVCNHLTDEAKSLTKQADGYLNRAKNLVETIEKNWRLK